MAVLKKGTAELEQIALRIANDPARMARIEEAARRLEDGEGLPLTDLARKVHEARWDKATTVRQAAISRKERVHA